MCRNCMFRSPSQHYQHIPTVLQWMLGSSTFSRTHDVLDEVSAAGGLCVPLQFTGSCLNEVLVTGLRYM